MRGSDQAMPRPMERAGINLGRNFPFYVVIGCTFFNAVLCFLNTRGMNTSATTVILSELALTGVSFLYAFHRLDKSKTYWLIIIALQFLLAMVVSLGKDELMMKSLRDILIMPVFIALGLSAYRVNFSKILMIMTIVITIFALYEAFFVENFVNWFNVKNYFIAKGSASDFTYVDNGLFVSSERPSGRFFIDIPGFHRVSSIFLEPLSLGFYGFVAGLYYIAMKDRLSRLHYAAGLLLCLFLIWLADGRMALGALAVAFLLRPVFARLDHRLSVLIFPVLFLLSVFLYTADALDPSGEGVGARIMSTMWLLSHTNLEILFGLSSYAPLSSVDSGIGNILGDQGLLGLFLYWLPPIFFLRVLPKEARIFMFGTSFYLTFGFLISPAIYTIKTAALLWFTYGYLISKYLLHKDPEEDEVQAR